MENELHNGTEFSFQSSKTDICDYVGGHKYPASRLVFCPIKYQPPSSNDKMSSKTSDQFIGWSDLRRDLLVSSFSAGNPIISNGSQHSSQCETKNRVFRCGIFHRASRTSNSTLYDDPVEYRNTSLVNDRQNNRESGKTMAKRIKVVDTRGACSCKFQFTIKWELGNYFYIELRQRSGHAYHQSHPKHIDPNSVPIPTRLLTSEQIDNIVHIVHATSNNGTGRNCLVGKYGKFLNLMKTAYIC